MEEYSIFARISQSEFGNIVVSAQDLGHKTRIYFKDKSFLDCFVSRKTKAKRFAFHGERKHLNKKFFRLDNTPDPSWKKVGTFPLHFHNGSYERVVRPPFKTGDLKTNFREFLMQSSSFGRRDAESISIKTGLFV